MKLYTDDSMVNECEIVGGVRSYEGNRSTQRQLPEFHFVQGVVWSQSVIVMVSLLITNADSVGDYL